MTPYITKDDGTRSIPKAPYYVLSRDEFMSGWGPAKDKVNVIVLPCTSYQEALEVQRYARSRTDQSYVRVVVRKPKLRPGVLYSLATRELFPAWYPENTEEAQ